MTLYALLIIAGTANWDGSTAMLGVYYEHEKCLVAQADRRLSHLEVVCFELREPSYRRDDVAD